ncbi:MAG: MlaC/ttg2D family ABC transporter substrate-binding protein [Candidatus Binatia bacterium]
MINTFKCLLSSFAVVVCIGQGMVYADTPAEQLQETIQQVLTVVNGSSKRSEKELKETLRDILMPRFDWPEMAKQALGKYWDDVPSRQNEFVEVFAEFLGNSYVGKIGSYQDEKILFVRESIERNQAQVDTKVIPGKGDPTLVNYRLHRLQGEWKIYDVVVEDISLVGNYRSQFNRILATGSFDDLLKRMREKNPKTAH